MADNADNDDFEHLNEEQRAALEQCLKLLQQAQDIIERKLDRKHAPEQKSNLN